MLLGYYLFALAIAFIPGSTLLTLGVLLGLIPAHIFFLKYFEELELQLRFGESYNEYKRKVPFLFPKLSAG
jgi:protein-S-isoprenylcysteine O-methyltransferase Ste14